MLNLVSLSPTPSRGYTLSHLSDNTGTITTQVVIISTLFHSVLGPLMLSVKLAARKRLLIEGLSGWLLFPPFLSCVGQSHSSMDAQLTFHST